MNILITGDAGSGKSTVKEALIDKGYLVIDADQGYGHWQHIHNGGSFKSRPSGQQKDYSWRWKTNKLEKLLSSNESGLIFCGISDNQQEFYKYFDKIILLKTDIDTNVNRLRNRTNNPFGKRPGDIELVKMNHDVFQESMEQQGAIVIDANQPLDIVLTEVIKNLDES